MKAEKTVKYRYVGGGEFYHGIPARDLTKADWERLTAEQQALVAGSPLYEETESQGRTLTGTGKVAGLQGRTLAGTGKSQGPGETGEVSKKMEAA